MLNPWFGISVKMALLGFEAQQVIGLRMLRLMAGGAIAQREAGRMFTEKNAAAASAGFQAALSAARGRDAAGITGQAVKGYRSRVRANRRRLTR